MKVLLLLLIIVHFVIVLAVPVCFVVIPFATPWYVAIPLMIYLFNLCYTNVQCGLTRLENQLRLKIGLPKIDGFIKHYMVDPWRKYAKSKKSNKHAA